MAGGLFALPAADRSGDRWKPRSLRSMLRPRGERNHSDLPLLTVARERGVFVRSADDANHNAIPDDLSNYKVARSGDLVINKMKAWQGSLGLAPVDGIVSPAYYVFEADFAVPRFGEYLLRSRPYVAKFGAASDGVRIGQWDLNIPRMRNIGVMLPPAAEQAAIVKYLDHANARIDMAIAAKRRLLILLKEQRDYFEKELIVEALSTSGGAHESGSRWIGKVPNHWVKYRTKQLLADVDERSSAGTEEVLSVSHLTGVTPRSSKEISMFEAKSYVGHKLCRPGDLVVNTMWAWMGALGIANQVGIVSPAYNVYRPTIPNVVDVRFLAHLLKSRPYNSMFRALSTGIRPSRLRFYPDQMLALSLYLPPFEEQLAINRKIAEAVLEINPMIGRVSREIELLKEFRSRLVADVATGQVDVRMIAARLPEAPESFDNLVPESDDALEEALSAGEE